ncbi:hypothetical protein AB0B48_31385 [Micromonospora sp. NPDC049089]
MAALILLAAAAPLALSQMLPDPSRLPALAALAVAGAAAGYANSGST